MDKNIINEVKRIKQLMNINEVVIDEGFKDFIRVASLCAILATGEISCKKIDTSDISTNQVTKISDWSKIPQEEMEKMGFKSVNTISNDTLKSVRKYNSRQPWVGIWKFTENFRSANKEFLIISPNNLLDRNNIVGSKVYWCAWSDERQVYDIFPLRFVSGEIYYPSIHDNKPYKFGLKGYSKSKNLNEYFEITFYGKDSLDITNWIAGKAIRMDKLPYP